MYLYIHFIYIYQKEVHVYVHIISDKFFVPRHSWAESFTLAVDMFDTSGVAAVICSTALLSWL